jgi:hypothetical protein
MSELSDNQRIEKACEDGAFQAALQRYAHANGSSMAIMQAAALALGIAELIKEAEDTARILSDPVTVHLNMLSGTIATISMENCAHAHGIQFNDLEAAEAALASLKAENERLREVMRPFAMMHAKLNGPDITKVTLSTEAGAYWTISWGPFVKAAEVIGKQPIPDWARAQCAALSPTEKLVQPTSAHAEARCDHPVSEDVAFAINEVETAISNVKATPGMRGPYFVKGPDGGEA